MNISKTVEHYFNQKNFGDHFTGCGIFILKNDGQIIHRYPDFKDDSSVGALMGGVWQAAMTLTQFMDKDIEKHDFRLGFDTASTGVYILPFTGNKYDFYIGLLYKDKVNPAQLKNNLRGLRDDLEKYLVENFK